MIRIGMLILASLVTITPVTTMVPLATRTP